MALSKPQGVTERRCVVLCNCANDRSLAILAVALLPVNSHICALSTGPGLQLTGVHAAS